jgi:hypothetical protein
MDAATRLAAGEYNLRFCLRLTPVSALLSGLLIQTFCCGGSDCLILLSFEDLAVLMCVVAGKCH